MASLGPWMKTTNIYKDLSQRLKAERRTSVGQMFVDINGRDVSGKSVRLSDYVGRGNYVLVDFGHRGVALVMRKYQTWSACTVSSRTRG